MFTSSFLFFADSDKKPTEGEEAIKIDLPTPPEEEEKTEEQKSKSETGEEKQEEILELDGATQGKQRLQRLWIDKRFG